MKTIHKIFTLLITLLAFSSCMDEYTEEFIANSPVYLSYEDLRSAIKITESRDLKHPGKIYFKDGFLFINEMLEGIHIIDNHDPRNPQNIGFIEVPGNVDIAIKDNILFADSYVDLLAIDISDINNPKEVNRVEDVFPYTTPKLKDEQFPVGSVDQEMGVVIDWEITKIRQEMEPRHYPIRYYEYDGAMRMSDGFSPAMSSNSGGGASFGIGGSMARFGLYDDYLYAVDFSTLYMFDVKNADTPKDIGKQNVGWNVETMFIYDKHMFFGTRTGMRIFTLEVATTPNYIGEFNHVSSCDPVVISEGYAYVTLRGGNDCGSTVNRLDVLKLSTDYTENELLASFPLHGPYGLGIDDETLFVCDGDAGLKIFDVADKLQIDDNKIAAFPNIKTFDVIPFNDFLFMIGDDGFYQYDYTDLNNIQQISFIPVTADE